MKSHCERQNDQNLNMTARVALYRWKKFNELTREKGQILIYRNPPPKTMRSRSEQGPVKCGYCKRSRTFLGQKESRQAALHGASGAPPPRTECPQSHRATNHCRIQWRVTEIYGAQWRRRRRRCREDCVHGSERLEDWKFRDCECADTAYAGAGRPCTALLGHRVRKWNARNIIAPPIIV